MTATVAAIKKQLVSCFEKCRNCAFRHFGAEYGSKCCWTALWQVLDLIPAVSDPPSRYDLTRKQNHQ